ncbi:hypothetical protein HYPSUDRAFT_208072 [Hypholoma sublateritium FD-334 SS-4]|uniref:RING-type domain-containing protein n=1 Tax=Hypholoma sublateritium (strain FD-334 SS-4) TaxID=945553 RepID=A0A0D2NF04_HYPSF|nr:hypothetical protein HYPSUDRAFT_208072 [Hypholoma sublateritium FD-334 SS-4]
MPTAGAQAQAAPIPLIVQPDNANDRVQFDDRLAHTSSSLLYYQRWAVDIGKSFERSENLFYMSLLVVTSLSLIFDKEFIMLLMTYFFGVPFSEQISVAQRFGIFCFMHIRDGKIVDPVPETDNDVAGAAGDEHGLHHPRQQLPFVERYLLKYRLVEYYRILNPTLYLATQYFLLAKLANCQPIPLLAWFTVILTIYVPDFGPIAYFTPPVQFAPPANVEAPAERPLPAPVEPYSAHECPTFSNTYEVDKEHCVASASGAEPHPRASTRTKTRFAIVRGCPRHPMGALCSNSNIRGVSCTCSDCNCSIVLDGDRSTCAVCQGDFADSRREPVRILRCEHAFHAGCIDDWLTRSSFVCPFCQTCPFYSSLQQLLDDLPRRK